MEIHKVWALTSRFMGKAFNIIYSTILWLHQHCISIFNFKHGLYDWILVVLIKNLGQVEMLSQCCCCRTVLMWKTVKLFLALNCVNNLESLVVKLPVIEFLQYVWTHSWSCTSSNGVAQHETLQTFKTDDNTSQCSKRLKYKLAKFEFCVV